MVRKINRITIGHETSDNRCSMFSNGNWLHCCQIHDINCILALENLSYKMRLEADIALFECVYKKNKLVAYVMYIGVRAWANTFWWINYRKESLEQRKT